VGAARNDLRLMAVARPAAQGQFVFVSIAFACQIYGFVANDFSVVNVATNSNSALPLAYRVAASWGSHEGSLLLWTLMLTGWTVAVTVFSRHLPQEVSARVIGVMGLVGVGFLAFMLFTSNPFERLLPAAADGRDLNPLLQDPGMVFHPPMLYMGYVGFSVAFAFAIAALMGGQLDAAWARWSRPWTTVAWVSLTLGICLGSYWAYYELGWGGWWFWDPAADPPARRARHQSAHAACRSVRPRRRGGWPLPGPPPCEGADCQRRGSCRGRASGGSSSDAAIVQKFCTMSSGKCRKNALDRLRNLIQVSDIFSYCSS
jgi:cytochrome c biogenesis factor